MYSYILSVSLCSLVSYLYYSSCYWSINNRCISWNLSSYIYTSVSLHTKPSISLWILSKALCYSIVSMYRVVYFIHYTILRLFILPFLTGFFRIFSFLVVGFLFHVLGTSFTFGILLSYYKFMFAIVGVQLS